jgi:hypothetical protein
VCIHVPTKKRKKLDPLGEKGLFIGYSETSKAYRIWIPVLRKIVVRRYVRFEEGLAYMKSLELIPITKDKE